MIYIYFIASLATFDHTAGPGVEHNIRGYLRGSKSFFMVWSCIEVTCSQVMIWVAYKYINIYIQLYTDYIHIYIYYKLVVQEAGLETLVVWLRSCRSLVQARSVQGLDAVKTSDHQHDNQHDNTHDGSMCAIYGNIYHQYTPMLVSIYIYTIHGSYGTSVNLIWVHLQCSWDLTYLKSEDRV